MDLYLKERARSKPEYPEKPPDNCCHYINCYGVGGRFGHGFIWAADDSEGWGWG